MIKKMLLAAALAWLACVGSVTAQTCAPGTCCNTNPTTGTPACGAAAGNPLNVMSGNKFQREVDMPALPGVLGLELVRYYNSEAALADERSIIGRGWRLSYEAELYFVPGGDRITVYQGDGTQTRYEKAWVQFEPGVTVYNTNEPGQSSMRAQRVAGTLEYSLTLPNGNLQTFDAQGKLVRITAPTGEYVTLKRDVAGFLLRVTDPQGRFLSLRHLPPHEVRTTNKFRGVQFIDSPVGRFAYSYGSTMPAGSDAKPEVLIANLVKVALPTHYDPDKKVNPLGASGDRGTTTSTVNRIYHYEDARHPMLLTGITVQGQGSDGKAMNERIVTWGYDARGRANLSVKGAYDPKKPGPEQVTLEFHTKPSDGSGTTILTNSLGQTTTYIYAQINGKAELLEVRGPGCATCGPTNVRHRYDRRGRLMEDIELDAKGQPVRGEVMQYDGVDRVTRVSEVRYRNGKAGALRMKVRYQYGADVRNQVPTLVARPSVVPGKESVTRIEYNDAWQPTRIAQEGFSPIDERGDPTPQGTPIRRQTTYSYKRINGRSVLTQIDGPLPNGPKGTPEDSDIVQIEWDRRANFATAVVRPTNQRSTVVVDDAGRALEVTKPDGHVFRYRYTYAGDLQQIDRRVAGQLVDGIAYLHDAMGRIVERVLLYEGGEMPQRYQAYDVAGRLQWQADAIGVLRQAKYDTEDHLLASVVVGAGMRQEERYGYDVAGRLERVEDNTGAVRRFVRDEAGALVATVDPLDRWTRFERDDDSLRIIRAANTGKPLALRYELDERGTLVAVTAQASDGMHTVRTVKHRRAVDDFGREVVEMNPDTGTEVRSFDALDHLVQVRKAEGSTVNLEYDAAGRLVQFTTRSKKSDVQIVRYVFEGSRLVRIEDSQQTEQYLYDERGRVQSKSTVLQLNDREQVTSTVRYRYDEQGLLAASSLPDGSEIEFERNGQRQIVAVHRRSGPWLPFGWGRTTLARDLQRDLVGLTHITYGNGVQGQWQRSKEGVLARIAYTEPQLSQSNALWDGRLLFDPAGNIVVQGQFARSDAAQPAVAVIAYDEHDQLAQALRKSPAMMRGGNEAAATAWRFHEDSLGNRLFGQQAQPSAEMGHTLKTSYSPDGNRVSGRAVDAGGRPVQDAKRQYRWDSLGRLLSVTRDGQATTYRYNHLGLRVSKRGSIEQHYLYDEHRHRIAELDAQGKLTREYVWLGDQLLAVIDSEQPQALANSEGRVLERAAAFVKAAMRILTGSGESIAYVHANQLSAPVAMTDEHGKVVWHADYAPFGQRMETSGAQAMRLDLRLPGQWEDEESGLYYNDQRYYDPEQGRYISPDPLGLRGGLNAYAYVNNNPLGFGDPLGLVLFAFDGTGNSDPAAAGDSISNVRKFYIGYDEIANGKAFYITGIGTTNADMPYEGSMLSGDGFDQRVTLGFSFLDRLIDGSNETSTLDIDVVGFSRGAAEARVWTNLLVKAMADGAYSTKEGKKRCLNLRFEGLWDTVPHLGLNHGNESKYDFEIPAQMKYAVQAIALDEHRGGIADFNAISIFDTPQTSSVSNRREIGFVGSHADIGGGYGTGDLSDAALMWMVKQATDQGVKFGDDFATNGWNVISDPILHDKSGNKIDPPTFPLPYGDREFAYGNGTDVMQSQAVIGANDTEWARGFVTYYPTWCGPSGAPAVGVVDMARYSEWLKGQGVNISYTAPYTAPATARPCN